MDPETPTPDGAEAFSIEPGDAGTPEVSAPEGGESPGGESFRDKVRRKAGEMGKAALGKAANAGLHVAAKGLEQLPGNRVVSEETGGEVKSIYPVVITEGGSGESPTGEQPDAVPQPVEDAPEEPTTEDRTDQQIPYNLDLLKEQLDHLKSSAGPDIRQKYVPPEGWEGTVDGDAVQSEINWIEEQIERLEAQAAEGETPAVEEPAATSIAKEDKVPIAQPDLTEEIQPEAPAPAAIEQKLKSAKASNDQYEVTVEPDQRPGGIGLTIRQRNLDRPGGKTQVIHDARPPFVLEDVNRAIAHLADPNKEPAARLPYIANRTASELTVLREALQRGLGQETVTEEAAATEAAADKDPFSVDQPAAEAALEDEDLGAIPFPKEGAPELDGEAIRAEDVAQKTAEAAEDPFAVEQPGVDAILANPDLQPFPLPKGEAATEDPFAVEQPAAEAALSDPNAGAIRMDDVPVAQRPELDGQEEAAKPDKAAAVEEDPLAVSQPAAEAALEDEDLGAIPFPKEGASELDGEATRAGDVAPTGETLEEAAATEAAAEEEPAAQSEAALSPEQAEINERLDRLEQQYAEIREAIAEIKQMLDEMQARQQPTAAPTGPVAPTPAQPPTQQGAPGVTDQPATGEGDEGLTTQGAERQPSQGEDLTTPEGDIDQRLSRLEEGAAQSAQELGGVRRRLQDELDGRSGTPTPTDRPPTLEPDQPTPVEPEPPTPDRPTDVEPEPVLPPTPEPDQPTVEGGGRDEGGEAAAPTDAERIRALEQQVQVLLLREAQREQAEAERKKMSKWLLGAKLVGMGVGFAAVMATPVAPMALLIGGIGGGFLGKGVELLAGRSAKKNLEKFAASTDPQEKAELEKRINRAQKIGRIASVISSGLFGLGTGALFGSFIKTTIAPSLEQTPDYVQPKDDPLVHKPFDAIGTPDPIDQTVSSGTFIDGNYADFSGFKGWEILEKTRGWRSLRILINGTNPHPTADRLVAKGIEDYITSHKLSFSVLDGSKNALLTHDAISDVLQGTNVNTALQPLFSSINPPVY